MSNQENEHREDGNKRVGAFLLAFDHTMVDGAGINSLTGAVLPSAITYNGLRPAVEGAGNGTTGQWLIKRIESHSDLNVFFDYNTSISFDSFFGNGSSFISFTNNLEISKHSINLVVYMSYCSEVKVYDNVKLRPEASTLAETNAADFVKRYGDSYISGFNFGGKLFWIISIETESLSEYNKIKTFVDAKASLLVDAEARSAFFNELKYSFDILTINSLGYAEGPFGEIGGSYKIEQMEEIIGKFMKSVNSTSMIPINARIVAYDIDLDSLDITSIKDVLKDLTNLYLKWKSYQNDIEYIIKNPLEFYDYNEVKLNELLQMARQQQQEIKRFVRHDLYENNIRVYDTSIILTPELYPIPCTRIKNLKSAEVTVDSASEYGISSGIEVKKGEKYVITANPTESWRLADVQHNPLSKYVSADGYGIIVKSAIAKDLTFGSLIGKVNDKYFQLGTNKTIKFNENGTLFLMCNDAPKVTPGYQDNSGKIKVTIKQQVRSESA